MASTMSLVSNPSSSASPLNSRNHSRTSRCRPRLQWTSLLLVLASCVLKVAADSPGPPQPQETLMVDSKVPTLVDGRWIMLSQEDVDHRELVKRSETDAVVVSITTTFSKAVSTVTSASTSTVASASALPSPLDGSISSNFSTSSSGTNNCPSFINSFLTNPTFKECYPFSLLLQQGSQSFFDAEKSLVSITQVLDASCSANVTLCNTYLTELDKNMTDASNCKTDFDLGQQVVNNIHMSIIAYQTLYSATCLKDPDTAAYCFANAVTNLTTPSNVYFYYLPLNISLPGSTLPSCGWCVQQTMGIYQSASADRELPIANTYASAAQQVNTVCGPSFVNSTLPNAIVESGGLSLLPQHLLLALPLLIAFQWLL